MKLIAPSILSADFTKLGDEIKAVEDAGADWIHIDVMDGHFVPNITYGPIIVEACRRVTNLPLDVHLMIEKPDLLINDFISAGADLVSVHVETCPHLHRSVQLIRNAGAKAGVALNPATPVAALELVLEHLDFVLIMSVNPGFGGQSFIPETLGKVRQLKDMIRKKNLNPLIQLDGGVNAQTIEKIASAGTDVFVAGSAIFGSGHYDEIIQLFRKTIGR
ncbi:MAG: ribulose-phosphate 3-epimerase [Thermodesulfobacteriota bacterium]